MVEPLTSCLAAFAQDQFPWVAASADSPGVRVVDALHVLSIRHLLNSSAARDTVIATGLPWPEHTNDLHCVDGLMIMRRHGEEVVIVGEETSAFRRIRDVLSPGAEPDAIAFDLSDGMRVLEFHGPLLDMWLSHLVDASSIPVVGRASRCRLADIAVLLLRSSAESIHVVADRSLSPYLAQWLAFTHEGAFART